VAVRQTRTLRPLSGPASPAAPMASAPSLRGPLTLGTPGTGKRSAGKPHAACDEAGAGNVSEGGTRHPLYNRKGPDRKLPTCRCARLLSTLLTWRELETWPGWNCAPTEQSKALGWKPSTYRARASSRPYLQGACSVSGSPRCGGPGCPPPGARDGRALGLAGTAWRRADQQPCRACLVLWRLVAPTLAGDSQCQGPPLGGAPLVAQSDGASACSGHLSGAGRCCGQSVYEPATGRAWMAQSSSLPPVIAHDQTMR
jgi:hypothetical protein